jgi:hypothetical protein
MAIEVQNTKIVRAIDLQTLADATAAEIEVDSRGFHHARFVFLTGAVAATSNISVAKIQSAATSGGAKTDVSGALLANGTISAASTSSDTMHAIDVDLTDKSIGQFLSVVLTGSVAANIDIAVFCILSRNNAPVTTAAEAGFVSLVSA